MDVRELSDEAESILELLRTAVSEERFAYDYTRKWRFLCLTPSEHRFLCEVLGVDLPQRVRFEPDKKPKDKTPKRDGQRPRTAKQRARTKTQDRAPSHKNSGSHRSSKS